MAIEVAERGIEVPKVFITGGTSGTGQAIALEFARSGFDIATSWRSREKPAQETVGLLAETGGNHLVEQIDITDDSARKAHLARVKEWCGGRALFGAVLSASGGGETDVRSVQGYKDKINKDTQGALVTELFYGGLLDAESTLSLLTSHQAEYLDETLPNTEGTELPIAPWEDINDYYEEIAISKHNGIIFVGDVVAELQETVPFRYLLASADVLSGSAVMYASAMKFFAVKHPHPEGKKESRQEKHDRAIEFRKVQIRSLIGPDGKPLDDTILTQEEFGKRIVEVMKDTSWQGSRKLLIPDHLKEA